MFQVIRTTFRVETNLKLIKKKKKLVSFISPISREIYICIFFLSSIKKRTNFLFPNYSYTESPHKTSIGSGTTAKGPTPCRPTTENFLLENQHRWRGSPKSRRIILASRHIARRTIAEKSATRLIRRQKGIIVHGGNNTVAQVPGSVTSVSAHARMPVVLKIYNPVGAYGATGFKSRRYREPIQCFPWK